MCAQLIDEAEGLDKIEELQNHSHEDIYDKAVLILETYFDVEDGEAENLAPQVEKSTLMPAAWVPLSSSGCERYIHSYSQAC